MKVFFIYLLTCIQLLSSSNATAQYANLIADAVTFTAHTSYRESNSWPDTSTRGSDASFSSYTRAHFGQMPGCTAIGVGNISAYTLQSLYKIPVADSTFGNSPYRIRFKKEGPLTGVGIGLYGASALLKTKEQPLSREKVLGLAKNQISRFDRGATRQFSTVAQQASDLLVVSSMTMPLLYLTKEKTRKDFSRIFLMQAETLLLTTGLITLTKTIVYRPRPFTYNMAVPISNKLNLKARESFFSGHVATTASMSFFTATTFSQYFPHSRLKPFVWSYAIVWPAATGYFRYAAGKHFPTDILTGYIVGAVTGMVIPKIHQKIRKEK